MPRQAQRHHTPVPQPLGGFAAIGATLACFLPILFGFLVPASYLARRVVAALSGRRPAARACREWIGEQRHARGDRDARRDHRQPRPRLFGARHAEPRRADPRPHRLDRLRGAGHGARGRPARAARLARQCRRRRHARHLRHLHRPDPDRLRRGADLRLCDPLPGDLRRRHRGGPRQGQPASRHGGAQPRQPPGKGALRPSTCR